MTAKELLSKLLVSLGHLEDHKHRASQAYNSEVGGKEGYNLLFGMVVGVSEAKRAVANYLTKLDEPDGR